MSKYGFLNSYVKNSVGISIGRSKFSMQHEHLTTFSSGYWFPVFCLEVLPGDTFDVNLRELIRMLTPVVPTMDNAILDLAAFWVPNRLCCKGQDDWKNICVGADPSAWTDGFDETLITTGNVVHLNAGAKNTVASGNANIQSMSLASYLGVPIGNKNCYNNLSALPFNAVFRIWNEWLRDENLAEEFDWRNLDNTGFLTKPLSEAGVLAAYKIKDYFTSALPAPQKGGAVLVPIGDSAPIKFGKGSTTADVQATDNSVNVMDDTTGKIAYFANENAPALSAGWQKVVMAADLTEATGASVNAIRMAFALQRLEEKLARRGSRYNEFLKAVFGVNAPAGLIEMTEMIGGGSVPINVTQVLQTSSTNDASPLGQTGAFSNTYDGKIQFSKSFVEYGFVIIMATVRPVQSYSQGLPLMFRRYSPLDIYSPTFAFIGEQPIYKEELYYDETTTRYSSLNGIEVPDAPVWGYKPAWEEYRRYIKRVTGNFAPNANDLTLSAWTYTSNFDAVPTLSNQFMKQPASQIGQTLVDTTTLTQFIGDFVAEVVATRPLPVQSIPGLLDHF